MRLILFLILFTTLFNCFGQLNQNKQISAGIGFYDAINIGYKQKINNDFSIHFSLGSNFKIYNNEEYYSAGVSIEHGFTDGKETTKWFLSGKIYDVSINDIYYRWNFLALSPCIGFYQNITEELGLCIDAGPAFNIVLYNKRKSFETVGWPYHVLANLRIQIYFGL